MERGAIASRDAGCFEGYATTGPGGYPRPRDPRDANSNFRRCTEVCHPRARRCKGFRNTKVVEIVLPFLRVLCFALTSISSVPLTAISASAELPDNSLAGEVSKILPAVVTVWASHAGTQGTVHRVGSGFIIDQTGLVITNRHVINGESNFNIITSDGMTFVATVVGAADLTDIALLRIPLSNSATHIARFGDSDALRVGDTVLAIGNPLGLSGTVTVGIVSGLNRNIMESPFDDYIQTDAAINHGNSGGPLVNVRGEVVGMNSVIFAPGSYGGSIGLGFAIPSNVLRFVADQLGQYGRVMPGWVGAQFQQPTPQLRESFGLAQSAQGALVLDALPDSPAATAGLQTGDVVLEFNGRTVTDIRSLARDIATAPIERPSSMHVWRNLTRWSLVVVPTLDPRTATRELSDVTVKPMTTEPPHGLGLQLSSLTQSLKASHGLGPDRSGVIATEVAPHSAANDAGLLPGDLILRVGDCDTSSASSIMQCLHVRAAADHRYVAILVQHDRESRWVALEISSAK
jgi:serine protease Do